jgi:hypothetical protein
MTDWWYVSNGTRNGPISDHDLRRLLIEGTLASDSLVWKQGMSEWQSVGTIPTLASAIASLPPDIPKAQRPPEVPKAQPSATSGGWRRLMRHLGSSIALVLGCLSLASGVAQLAGGQVTGGPITSGMVMILGSLAYRSAKKRRLGEVQSTTTRRVTEIALLLLAALVVLLQKDLKYLIATDPVPNVLIPLWALIAYLVVALIPRSATEAVARE